MLPPFHFIDIKKKTRKHKAQSKDEQEVLRDGD